MTRAIRQAYDKTNDKGMTRVRHSVKCTKKKTAQGARFSSFSVNLTSDKNHQNAEMQKEGQRRPLRPPLNPPPAAAKCGRQRGEGYAIPTTYLRQKRQDFHRPKNQLSTGHEPQAAAFVEGLSPFSKVRVRPLRRLLATVEGTRTSGGHFMRSLYPEGIETPLKAVSIAVTRPLAEPFRHSSPRHTLTPLHAHGTEFIGVLPFVDPPQRLIFYRANGQTPAGSHTRG